LETHLKAKTVCKYVEGQPIEGFELDVEAKLKRRRKATRDETDVERWEGIYRLLFPGEDVPFPCKQIFYDIDQALIIRTNKMDLHSF
jgi:hypothetical protein